MHASAPLLGVRWCVLIAAKASARRYQNKVDQEAFGRLIANFVFPSDAPTPGIGPPSLRLPHNLWVYATPRRSSQLAAVVCGEQRGRAQLLSRGTTAGRKRSRLMKPLVRMA
jgi:hypothetical protein